MGTTQRKSVMVDPNATSAEAICPPADEYELTFVQIIDYDFPRDKQGNIVQFDATKEPEEQFILEFELDYPYKDDPDFEKFDKLKIRYYCTPKFKIVRPTNPPKLYLLLKALNGGNYEQPTGFFDGWDEVEQFVGRKIRADIEPNAKGWASIVGTPKPVRARQRGVRAQVMDPLPKPTTISEADDVEEIVA